MLTLTPCDFTNEKDCEGYTTLLAHYMADPMGDSTPHTPEQNTLLIETLRAMPHAFVLLAKEKETYVGMATCFVTFSTFTIAPVINIHDIVVLKEARGKGVGREMLRYIHEVATSLGCSKVTLEVREDNPCAQHLYRSEGFMECSPPMKFWEKKVSLS